MPEKSAVLTRKRFDAAKNLAASSLYSKAEANQLVSKLCGMIEDHLLPVVQDLPLAKSERDFALLRMRCKKISDEGGY